MREYSCLTKTYLLLVFAKQNKSESYLNKMERLKKRDEIYKLSYRFFELDIAWKGFFIIACYIPGDNNFIFWKIY